ncbi:RCC1 domain-containing protein [Skeletonema marinoi]|uniref:RCC1 domain-containing protein n=1 Tax=Skeletonema marinoi TaxID=267567 RepID=A0AAD8YC53_9STRA|nr:RCC1 domain-containing protein [Skeletonema marinoi]
MFIDSIGRAWATGSNGKGQLCLGDEIDRLIPERIALPRKIVDIAVGGEFTLLLTDDGVVYGCGSNALGQLGLGPELQVVKQPMNIGLASPAKSISAGKDHSLIMTTDGYYVMGSNEFGQLCTDSGGEPLLVPRALAIDSVITEFQAVKSSTYILYRDGSVNGCGKNDFGQIGDGSNEDTFIAIVGVSDVVTLLGVGPSAESAFFVYKDGTVWGTGLNDKGQLGVGDTDNRNVPTLVKTDDITTVLLSAAEDHTLALKEDGSNTSYAPSASPKTPPPTSAPVEITSGPTMMGEDFFFWGDPKSIGEDGDGINIQQPINLGEGGCSVVSGGFIKSIEDYKGHLGINPEIVVQGLNALQPVDRVYDGSERISAPLFHRVFAGVENSINTGNIHSIILDREGRAYATGSNDAGQLCLGDEVNRVIPERIPVDNRIIDVAIGGEHTLLLDEFGNVYGCGSNQLGQLGLGTNIGTSSPVVVSGVVDVAHISAGKDHSLFKAADGIYVTGSNRYGQLCSTTDTTELYVPAKLDLDNGIADNIKQFDAISSSSFILYADGSANGCGKNDFGQLGDGSNEDASITTVVLDGAVRILGVGPSAESAFFVTESKEIFGTGLNDKGQLGIGDQKDRNTPTRVDFDDKVMVSVFAAARDHSIALILGDGTVSPTITPATLEPTSSILIQVHLLHPQQSLSRVLRQKKKGDSFPTYAPTSEEQPNQPPTQLSNELYYWGSGNQSEAKVKSLLLKEEMRQLLTYPQSAGYIDSLDDYHGHLGQGNDVTQGQNGFTVITNVLDESEESISPPFFTRAFAGAEQFASPGSMHTILLDSEGGVYATGSNSKGQLCIGDFADRYIPQRIGIVGEVVGVAIGNEHTLLLMNDGTVMGCGSNEFGQLGLGEDIKVENAPTMIDIEGTVDGISSGLAFSLFKSSAGLFVTGNNSYRQLCFDTEGLGSSISVDLLTSFEAIQSSSFILFKDGGVAACGRNNFGQLGNGSNEDVLRTLVTIPDNTPIRRLGVGPSALSAFFVNTAEVDISSTGAIVVRADQISASSDHTLSRLSEGTAV